MKGLQIAPPDNVAVAFVPGKAGETMEYGEKTVVLAEDVPAGHKIAIAPICEGEAVVKYGFPIGLAKQNILPGQWVHTHNLRTGLDGLLDYTYDPKLTPPPAREAKTFQGYVRKNGRVGIRNEIWVIPTVGCVNGVALALEKKANLLAQGKVDGVYAFPHPHGCSQVSTDLERTQRVLAGLTKHPNAGGVLVLGLGCEVNYIDAFKAVLGEYDAERIRFLNCQDSPDEIGEGMEILKELIALAAEDRRTPVSADKLTVGLKCGGSDGFSGITANPVVGAFSDALVSMGGSTILTEVPEMFGAETILMNRCGEEALFQKTVALIDDFKRYFMHYEQPIYENPSPGNKAGGLSTLEDKSLGCTQKGGTATVTGVLDYAEHQGNPGLNLMSAPGNDLVASTACAAAGAQLVLFTTGRGTPFGCPVPTLKISTNPTLAAKKPGWIDFDASPVLAGRSVADMGEALLDMVLAVASGETYAKNEENGYRDIAIFKDGVTQ